MEKRSRFRCGIDTGGTFTDFVAVEEQTGDLITAKWPSSPSRPVDAILRVLAESGVSAGSIDFLVLGTTIATNAILQRGGAKVLYLTTAGFEDVLYIQRMNRQFLYSYEWTKPQPFVERRNCLGVPERIDAGGRVLQPLEDRHLADLGAQIDRRLQELGRPEGKDIAAAFAVCLLFSYVNPEHELRLARFLEGRYPGVPVSLSHQVAPIWREYERGTTVTIDAYIKPMAGRFIADLRAGLAGIGYAGPWAVMKSNGGQATAESAEQQPINILLSGLSGGIIGGRYYGDLAGRKDLITLDMGGTSCDVGVVRGGEIGYTTNYEVAWGVPASAPFVDLTTVGAGGGSIAWIDKGGFLQVGPRSAGAEPGPVCYDKGGEEVTVTDANLVLGRLDPEYFLGGRIPLNPQKARERIEELGRRLDLDVSGTAQAIIDLANENMANTIRLVSIERGWDVREFSLVAFGGAGPLHASGIAGKLEMSRIIVPVNPGLCSAFGALIADLKVDKVWTRHFRSDGVDPAVVDEHFRGMVSSAREELRRDGFRGAAEVERVISMRYAGQNYEHDVPVADGAITADTLGKAYREFHRLHEQFYGYSISGEVIELIRFKVTAWGRRKRPRLPCLAAGPAPGPKTVRPVYFREEAREEGRGVGGIVDCPIYRRDTLPAGFVLAGPAVIEEPESTVLIHPGQQVRVEETGILTVTSVEDGREEAGRRGDR